MSRGGTTLSKDESKSIYRIPPYYYVHVLDQNTNTTKMEVGPKTYIRQDNEKVVSQGTQKHLLANNMQCYCIRLST